jgi:hypothetical protein
MIHSWIGGSKVKFFKGYINALILSAFVWALLYILYRSITGG